jgi:enoyl-CoA hydratase/carnithine racemase
MADVVLLFEHVAEGVVEVRLNRPDKHNALNDKLFRALAGAGERLARESGLRAVVLSGAGKSFCSGLDSSNFDNMASGQGGAAAVDRLTPRTHGAANLPQYTAMVWRDIPVPVIAAVHGVAFGGGLQVALGADMRFIAPDACLSVMEIKWGLVPDMAGMVLLTELVRGDRVRELSYSGRIVEAREAVEIGLATRVCDNPREEALAMARELAGRNPDAVRAMKRLLNQAAMPEAQAATILQAESAEQDGIIASPNQMEAVAANLEKRAPHFQD